MEQLFKRIEPSQQVNSASNKSAKLQVITLFSKQEIIKIALIHLINCTIHYINFIYEY